MRKIAASALSQTTSRVSRTLRWCLSRSRLQALLVTTAVAVLVSGLLVGLPAKQVAGQPLPTFAPIAPQANARQSQTDLALDVPFQVRFTKPMNESTVEAAVQIDPPVGVKFMWDATAQTLSIRPNPHWLPHTDYRVVILTTATDQEGLALSAPIEARFTSGARTGGTITATRMVGDQIAPTTAFQVTFTRPVKLTTVATRLGIAPLVDFALVGDDPTDATSQVFTLTPRSALTTGTIYVVSMSEGGMDSSGSLLTPIAPLQAQTLETPAVQAFLPAGGTTTGDNNQPVSLRFTVPMDHKSTEAAFSITANGRGVSGSFTWSESDTTLTFVPRRSFYLGSTVTVKIAVTARSAGGLKMAAPDAATFTIAAARSSRITYKNIPYTGGQSAADARWAGAEKYTMDLMNCTRTGGWVTSNGQCSSQSHHTLPKQKALSQDAGIATRVARPYAIALATNRVLTHTLGGSTVRSRMIAGGYTGYVVGENLGSPGAASQAGMIAVAVFFQNEYSYRGGHYRNIMNGSFHRAGVGVWVANGCTRVVINFYS